MAKKKSIDIGSLTADAQALILKQVREAEAEKDEKRYELHKEEVENYYATKKKLEDEMVKLLENFSIGGGFTSDKALILYKKYSPAKMLKIVASLPTKKPTTLKGYIKAHKAIVSGKVGASKRAAKKKDTPKKEVGVKAEASKAKAQMKKATAPIKRATAAIKKATAKKA